MALLLVLLCMSLVIVKGEGSHCMATTSGAQHGPSLYLRVCCVNSNLEQTVHMRENNREKIIICPPVRPHSCQALPGNLNSINTVIMILNLVDCKSWFDEGYNTSGVYTVNPDEQTPFEVRG